MSVPTTSLDSGCDGEPNSQESESLTPPLKCDSTSSLQNTLAQSAVNGALPEPDQQKNGSSETVSSAEHQQVISSVNGQDEKPRAETPHREIPGLLPLQPMAVASSNAVSTTLLTQSNSPRQPPPPLLPMKPVTAITLHAPVLATKSAPPPIPQTSPSGKAKGKSTVTSDVPSHKEATTSTSRTKQHVTQDQNPPEQEHPKLEEKQRKRKIGLKKRHSLGSSDSAERGDTESGEGDGDNGRKSKRARTRTQPFQSSDMDPNLMRAIKATAAVAQPNKSQEDKLVVFFKGEFLAVRNAEGGFYICQAMQNITRGSHKIRIRWLSQVPSKDIKGKGKGHSSRDVDEEKEEIGYDVYSPDFYDNTDFECILTNLELEKLGRDRFGLPLEERQRTENILRRAIEHEQGVYENVEVTEEHPDGLDVSLFHDESQLTRKRRRGRKGKTDSFSTSESDSKDEGESASGSSGASIEPEPTASTSVGASTSTGRGTKRTRAAALAAAVARKKSQYTQMMIDDEDDEDDDNDETSDEDIDEEDSDEEDSSSDSDSGKRRKRRASPRSRHLRTPRAKAMKRTTRRGKKSPPPKTSITPMKKRSNKKPEKEPAIPVESKVNSKSVNKGKIAKKRKSESSEELCAAMKDSDVSLNEGHDHSLKEDVQVVAKPTADQDEKKSSKESDPSAKETDGKCEANAANNSETKTNTAEMKATNANANRSDVLKSDLCIAKTEKLEVETRLQEEKDERKLTVTETKE